MWRIVIKQVLLNNPCSMNKFFSMLPLTMLTVFLCKMHKSYVALRKQTLSEEIAQSTVYHHLRQICVYLHFTIMHKVIEVT